MNASAVPGLPGSERGRHLWAKSSDDGPGHSLLGHMLDVGLVASVLVERRPSDVADAVGALGLSTDQAAAWLAMLAGLHDLGKATPAFQALWPAGAPAEALGRLYTPIPHGRSTILLLSPWFRDLGVSKRLASTLAHAVGIHHGWVDTADQLTTGQYDPRSIGEDTAPWTGWRTALCDDVRTAFGAHDIPTTKRIPPSTAWARIAGLTAVADWIGSGLPQRGRVDDMVSYLADRRRDVEARLAEVGWAPRGRWWRPPEHADFASWFGGTGAFEPRPLQVAVERALATTGSDPGLVIIEAPMGEGKTEAAFYSIVRPGAETGAYYALPTQATSDAMIGRLDDFVEQHKSRDVNLALAHGGARVPASLPTHPVDPEGSGANATAAAWFSSGRRELLAELGVGTVDQALLGVLPTKHHFVRLWALAGRTLVIDEVHAYDAYTGGLVEALVGWAAALDVVVVVMSATLPYATSAALVQAYARGRGVEAPELEATRYPRLSVVDRSGGARRSSFEASRHATVRVVPAPYALDALAAEVLAAAHVGGAVGVVVNRVDRAQALYRLVSGVPAEVALLHARMPKDDRSQRERALVRRLGPQGDPANRDVIVIGTQVIEQSLDLDFDVMFTDLAPVDLVLQRSGRLHRHAGRPRPDAHEHAVLHVAGMGTEESTGPEESAVESIYDAHVLWRTWAALVAAGGSIELPEDLDALVQRVYSDAPLSELERWADRIEVARRKQCEEHEAATGAVKAWSIPAPAADATACWAVTATDEADGRPWVLRAPTHLGEESVVVVPVSAAPTGWVVWGSDERARGTAKRASTSWIARALDRQIRVSRKRVVHALRALTPPTWWAASGPLRYMAPLELDRSGRWVVDPAVRLDDELGLVYEPLDEGSQS